MIAMSTLLPTCVPKKHEAVKKHVAPDHITQKPGVGYNYKMCGVCTKKCRRKSDCLVCNRIRIMTAHWERNLLEYWFGCLPRLSAAQLWMSDTCPSDWLRTQLLDGIQTKWILWWGLLVVVDECPHRTRQLLAVVVCEDSIRAQESMYVRC
jgi:hypothetical protein